MPHDFMPGLAGVPAATSSISDVDGQRGILEYRGIRVETLSSSGSGNDLAGPFGVVRLQPGMGSTGERKGQFLWKGKIRVFQLLYSEQPTALQEDRTQNDVMESHN